MFSNDIALKLPRIFKCETCDYCSSNKKDFNRHLNTIKHKHNIKQSESTISSQNCPKYSCLNCGKEYKDNSGLWRHNNKCLNNASNESIDKELILKLIKQNYDIIQDNSEFKQILEQNKTMIEMIKNIQLTNKLD